MKRFFGTALAAVLVAAPVTLVAQAHRAPQAQKEGVRHRGGAPVAMLLQHRSELGLSAAQVTRLEGIHQRWQTQNQPLLEQLRASGAWKGAKGDRAKLTPEQREARRQQMKQQRQGGQRGDGVRGQREVPEELRPVVQQLHANRRAAMEEVRSVLTAEQQTRLAQLIQQRRGGGERWGRGAR